jgi:hypothetical protein
MAKQVQFRRGTTSQHSTFTGAVGEITVDTDKDVVVVHDGSTAGGFPLARQLSDIGVTASVADLNATDVTTLGTVEASKVVTADANGDVTFSDDDKIVLGNSSDFQIYHAAGGASIIEETGGGDMILRGSNLKLRDADNNDYITMVDNGTGGTVVIKHNNSAKLETTSTGVNVTGTAEVDTLQFSDGSTQTSAGASTGKAIAMAIVFGG